MKLKSYIKKRIFSMLNKKKNKTNIVPEKIKKILFIRDARIGDMITTTPIFREIKKKYPDIIIDVVAGKNNYTVLDGNINVRNVYIYKKNILEIISLIMKIRHEQYDIIVEFHELPSITSIFMLRLFKGKINIGFEKKEYNFYDYSIESNGQNTHVLEKNKEILKLLKIDKCDKQYDLFYNEKQNEKIELLIKDMKNIVILNRDGSAECRVINEINTESIIKKLNSYCDINVILVTSPQNYSANNDFIKGLKGKVLLIQTDSIHELACLVDKSNFVITPDTSLIHVCGAYNKALIGIYSANTNNYIGWKPIVKKYELIRSSDLNNINYYTEREMDNAIEEMIRSEK